MKTLLDLLRVLRGPVPVPVPVSRFARTGWLAVWLGLAMVATPVRGQLRGEAGASVLVGLPQNGFHTQINGAGIGMGFFAGVADRRSPVLVGADLGFLIYGYERRSEPFSYTIPDVWVDVVTSNNIALAHFLVRVRPPAGPIRPYFDALMGFKYLFTTTQIENEWYYDEPIATSTNFDDAAVSYGLGGGIDINLAGGRGRGRPGVMLHAGVRYLFGGPAEYLREGSIRREGGWVRYDVARSETDLLINEFGVVVRF